MKRPLSPDPRRFRRGLLASAAGMLLATCAAAAPDLGSAADAAYAQHHVGKIVWRELITPDLGGAQRFYGGLFGWTFRAADGAATTPVRDAPAEYLIAMLDNEPVAGLLGRPAPSPAPVQPAWLSFFSVTDVDEARRNALAHGARSLAEPRSVGQRGRQAVLADPQGAIFAILAARSGDPPDELAAPGAWIWHSLLVREADKDAAFYQDVFGYEVFDLPNPDGREHVVLASDNLARASVNDMPDDSARRRAHWLGFVRVLDVAAAATRARELGGRVLVPAHADRHGGQVALIADPQGAVLGLMDWVEPIDQGSAR